MFSCSILSATKKCSRIAPLLELGPASCGVHLQLFGRGLRNCRRSGSQKAERDAPAQDVLGVGTQDADRVRDDTGTSHCDYSEERMRVKRVKSKREEKLTSEMSICISIFHPNGVFIRTKMRRHTRISPLYVNKFPCTRCEYKTKKDRKSLLGLSCSSSLCCCCILLFFLFPLHPFPFPFTFNPSPTLLPSSFVFCYFYCISVCEFKTFARY